MARRKNSRNSRGRNPVTRPLAPEAAAGHVNNIYLESDACSACQQAAQQLRLQPLRFFRRAARRETFREPVFLWITRLEVPRMICGSAALNAATAASRFPAARASSTFRTAVRI